MKKVLFFIALMSLFIPSTYALKEGCSNEEYSTLFDKVKNVEISYEYDEYYGYTIILKNMDTSLYAIDKFGIVYEPNDQGIAYKNPYNEGMYYISSFSMYELTFYAKENTTNCGGETLDLVNKLVPAYNEYSTTDVCKENPDDEYCAKLIDFTISEKQFQNRFSEELEKENAGNEDDKKTEEDESVVLDKASNWQLLFFLVLIIVVGTVMIVVIRIHNKKVDSKRAKRYSDIRRGKYNSGRIEDLIDKDEDK